MLPRLPGSAKQTWIVPSRFERGFLIDAVARLDEIRHRARNPLES
jgi:hypothetical protein